MIFLWIGALALAPSRGGAQGAPIKVGWSLPLRVSWSRSSILLASGFAASLLMDAGQTRGLARGGWNGFHETNPILGRSPSVARINVYSAVAGLTVLGVAAAVPARVRPWMLGVAFVVETLVVAGNARAGITVGFP
jgi:hypothetical protein